MSKVAQPSKQTVCLALVVAILLATVGVRIYPLWGQTTPFVSHCGDSLDHLVNGSKVQLMGRPAGPEKKLERSCKFNSETLIQHGPYPRGTYTVAAPLFRALGPLSLWATLLTQLLFLLLLLAGVILLGRLLHGLEAGLWSALLVSLGSTLISHSLCFSLDYPLAAMCSLGLYLLVASQGFSRIWPSALFGIWSALGAWIKLQYLIYLGPAALLALAASVFKGEHTLRRLANVLGGVCLFALGTWIVQGEVVQGEAVVGEGYFPWIHHKAGSLFEYASALTSSSEHVSQNYRGTRLVTWPLVLLEGMILNYNLVLFL